MNFKNLNILMLVVFNGDNESQSYIEVFILPFQFIYFHCFDMVLDDNIFNVYFFMFSYDISFELIEIKMF